MPGPSALCGSGPEECSASSLTYFFATSRMPSSGQSSISPFPALWWAAKGDWDQAHRIVMNESDANSAWVHAHLHRVEGDLGNAGYWYRRAGQPVAKDALEAEWERIVSALLA